MRRKHTPKTRRAATPPSGLIGLLLTASAVGFVPQTAFAQFGPPFTDPAALNSNATTDGAADKDKEISLTTDGSGNWIVVWTSTDDLGGTVGTEEDIFVSRSTDNGVTWTAVATLNSNAATDSGKDKKPFIATDTNGAWVVVWESDDNLGGTVGGDKDIFWSKSTDNGVTWSAVAALNGNAATDSGDDTSPRVAADRAATSNWIVVWESKDNLGGTIGGDEDILYSRSTDDAVTWSAVAALNSNAATDSGKDKKAFIATDTNGVWVTAWESDDTLGGTVGADKDIFWSKSTDNGGTWTAVTTLNSNATTDGGDDSNPNLAADRATTSTWVAAWESKENLTTNGTEGDLFETHSTDAATTWSTVAILNSNALSDVGKDKDANVQTDNAGRWVVAWSTTDDLSFTIGNDEDIVWACSNDHGKNWSQVAALNNNADISTGKDKKPILATDGACHWVVVWESTDTLSGTIGADEDVLTTRPESGLAITSGDVAYLKLNDGSGLTATDSSGNGNHGTVVNATWTDGMFAGAVNFDGTGDYVDVPTSIAASNLGSVSFWFRTNTNFTADAIMYYGSDVATGNGNGTENELHVNFTSTETVHFFIEGTPDVSITTTATLADGAWHHLAATWDINDYASLYVDGKFVNSVFHNADNFTFSSTHRLGRPGANSNLFTGRIDDVRIYNRVITACEVAKLATSSGLQFHWRFDDGAGTTAVDSVGGNNGTLTGVPTWVDGRLCGALDFDGIADYVDMGDVGDLADTDDVTITGWFNRDTFTTDDVIVAKRNGIGVAGDTGYIVYIDATTDQLIFRADDGIDLFILTSTSTFTATGWNHFAILWDQDSPAATEIYINGVADIATQTGTITNVGSMANALAFRVGAESDGGSPFDGKIDDVRVYNRALPAGAIPALALTYTVIDLGSLTGASSLGISVNNSEQVVGFDQAATTGNETAWRSQFCLATNLGTLTGGTVAAALGVNDAGTVCGWSDTTGGNRKAFTWTSGGGMVDLGTLTGRTDSEATAINANGEVSGTSLDFDTAPNNWLAFIYLPSPAYGFPAGMNSLGTIGTGDFSVAMDLNDSGQVVGGTAVDVSTFLFEPFIWLPSAAYGFSAGMNSLGTLGGTKALLIHRAQALNSKGETVGRSYTAGGEGHAFLWLPSAAYTLSAGINDLGVLTGGTSSWAFDINESGVVVGTSNITGGTFHAFRWETGTMTDLNNLIDANSGWTLTRAGGINNDGEIVGWGTNGNGDTHAFILVQTCSSTATLVQAAGLLLAQASAVTGPNGTLNKVLFDANGAPLAEILVTQAPPGDRFAYLVTANSLLFGGASSVRSGSPLGFAPGAVVDRTLQIDTTAGPRNFAATVSLVVDEQELAAMGLDPSNVELHRFDRTALPAPGAWVPAGVNVGEVSPTDVPGESGYVQNGDGTITYWAVTDQAALFAVGAPAGPTARPDAPSQPDPIANVPVPSMCGVGAIQVGFVFIPFFLIRGRRLRRRSPCADHRVN